MESFLNICELLQITPSDFFDPELPVKNQELMQLIPVSYTHLLCQSKQIYSFLGKQDSDHNFVGLDKTK